MGAAFGPLAIGLCVVFGGFVLLLLVEVYYFFYCRQKRELHGINLSSGERGNQTTTTKIPHPFDLICWWTRRLKYAISYVSRIRHHQKGAAILRTNASFEELQVASAPTPSLHSEFVANFFVGYGDLSGDTDILQLQGPPRSLFTIKEETKEDLESEDAMSKTGRSRGSSRSSSELFPHLDSGCNSPLETPFLTPPSSPPAISPPFLPYAHLLPQQENVAEETLPQHLLKSLNIIIDESFSSFSSSSSSSENITPPVLSSPPREPLTALMEETSSSSSSSPSTPFTVSPPRAVCSPKRGRNSLASFLDVPSQNRVYPLEASCFQPLACPPIREHQFPRGNFLFKNYLNGLPGRGSSPTNSFPSGKLEGSNFRPTSSSFTQFQHFSDPPPSTPPFYSALSSPIFISPTLGAIDVASSFHET